MGTHTMRLEGRWQCVLEQVGFRGVHCPVAYLEALPPVKQFRLLHPVGAVGREQMRRSGCTMCHPCFQKPFLPLHVSGRYVTPPVHHIRSRHVIFLTLDVRAIPREAQKPQGKLQGYSVSASMHWDCKCVPPHLAFYKLVLRVFASQELC